MTTKRPPCWQGPEYQPFVDAVRAIWFHCTPYRLGVAIGEAGATLPCPYPRGSRGALNFLDGVRWGVQVRARRAVEASQS